MWPTTFTDHFTENFLGEQFLFETFIHKIISRQNDCKELFVESWNQENSARGVRCESFDAAFLRVFLTYFSNHTFGLRNFSDSASAVFIASVGQCKKELEGRDTLLDVPL